MKKYHSIYLIFLILSLCSVPSAACANDHVVINTSDYSTKAGFENAVEDAFADNNLNEFSIVYKEDSDSDTTTENIKDYVTQHQNLVTPSSAADTVLYDVRNVKNKANVFGKDYLNVSGVPGVVIGLSHAKTKTYSLSFSATYNCEKSLIANTTWESSKSSTLTYSGTWKVPSKANGKNVKYGYLHMRPEYKVKSYDVYHKNYGTSKWIKDGTGTTKKAYSVNVRKTYTYK